jgi:hypothetical protein
MVAGVRSHAAGRSACARRRRECRIVFRLFATDVWLTANLLFDIHIVYRFFSKNLLISTLAPFRGNSKIPLMFHWCGSCRHAIIIVNLCDRTLAVSGGIIFGLRPILLSLSKVASCPPLQVGLLDHGRLGDKLPVVRFERLAELPPRSRCSISAASHAWHGP